MPSKSLPQIEQEVKCNAEGCNEHQFRSSGLCFDHFLLDEMAAWNDRDADRQAALDGAWWGDSMEEVLA